MKTPILLGKDKLLIISILAAVFIINILDVAYVFTKVHSTSFIALHITAISAFAIAAYFIYKYAFSKIRQKAEIEQNVSDYNKKLLFNPGKNGKVEKDPILTLEKNLNNSIQFIQQIGNGNYDYRLEELNEQNLAANKETLTGELLNMREQMKKVAEEERQRSWANQGVAKFSELLRTYTNNFDQLGDEVVKEIVKYLGANQGGLFIVREEEHEDETSLDLIACYAYERKKYVNKRIHYKEGLVGQCFMEAETIFLTDVPVNYVNITSGLGEATPTCIVIIPLKLNDRVEGVLEIASFTVLKPFQVSFLEKLAESLASTISNIKVSENTQELLKDSQLQTEQLRAQEEEMRQNMEELNATQEELERKSKESQFQYTRLNAVLDSATDAILTIDEEGKIENANKATEKLFGYVISNLIGQESRILMPDFDLHQLHLEKDTLNRNEGNILGTTGRKRGGNQVPLEVAINEVFLEGTKLYTAIIRDVSEREEHEKEQQQMIEEMRATEEELRQNMEELSATQEEIERQLTETNKLKLELEARENVFSVSTVLSESDPYGTIIHVNDKLCEVSMYPREELIGQPHSIFRHPDMPKEAFKHMWETIKAGNTFRGIVKNRRKDGGHYWVDATVAPVFDEDGKIIKYIGARYHITDDTLAETLFSEFLKKLGLEYNLVA